MRTTIYLVRHGETDWNMQGRWQGHADIPLNAVGREQSRRLAERFCAQGPHLHALYSSDLQRAWETAAALAEHVGIAARALPELREIDVGSWSGLTSTEVRASDPETYERIQSGEDLARGGGERFLDLYARVTASIERLAVAHHGETIAVISHGGPVRAMLLHAARDKRGVNPYRLHIGNTAITVIVRAQHGWDFAAINDMMHLEANAQAHDMMSAPPDDTERP